MTRRFWQPADRRGGLIPPLDPDGRFTDGSWATQVKNHDPHVVVFENVTDAGTLNSIDFTTNKVTAFFVHLFSTAGTLNIQANSNPAYSSNWQTIGTITDNGVFTTSNFYPHIRLSLTGSNAATAVLVRRIVAKIT